MQQIVCTGNDADSLQLQKLCRPYLISAGIENGIRYTFNMNPLTCKVLAQSAFVEGDITYNETQEHPYLFNMVSFNYITMEWMVVSLDKQIANTYGLVFSKSFGNCKCMNSLTPEQVC